MPGSGRESSMRPAARPITPLLLPRAFSLVELVIVVVIIGIIAAIAVPRLSNAATRAKGNALAQNLAVVREAIERYYAEHGRFPGYDPGTGTRDDDYFVDQILLFTDETGNTSETYGYPHVFGPYLRKPFPANPFNDLRTVYVKAAPTDADPEEDAAGWVAVLSTGDFGINAEEFDLAELETGSYTATEMYGGARSPGG